MPFTLKNIKDYFGFETLSAFAAEWKQLTEKEREDIRTGIENGSFTY